MSAKPSSPRALMWARVAELRIDIRVTEFFVCLTQTSRKENKDLLKEKEPAKAGLAKVGPKGLNR